MEVNILITAALILAGGITMLVGIIRTGELIHLVPESKYAATWRFLRIFMFIFLAGYFGACIVLFTDYREVVYTLTGVIFFLGAVFVLIVVATGKGTIGDLKATLLSKGEKEVMLKEIHHRVKNNLQVIISLLRIQSHHLTEQKTLLLFEECENRILSMALIHEQLYQSKDMANINVEKYIDTLIQNLLSAYHSNAKLTLESRINVPSLSIDTLVPLGLILNEVTSNSLKHAFPDRETGKLIISVDQIDDRTFRLVVGDDGIGAPEKVLQQATPTLGMELIGLLVNQLEGTIKRRPEPGTVYEIEFRELKK